MPTYGLCELPENVPFENAALCEPLGVALGTMEKANAKFGQTLMIMGAGSIGLCMLAVGKAMGMRKIVVVASSEKRLQIAKEMGAYEVIATSKQDLMKEMQRIHPGGAVALAGYGRGKVMQIRMDDIHINNLYVVGAGNNWNMHKMAVELMADGLVDLSAFVSEKLPLEDFQRAIEMARTRPQGFVKAVFEL